jgi:probable F420-dependent oxidoreductase
MRFGVVLPSFGAPARGDDVAENVRGVAQAADRLGYDVVWTSEHLIFPREVKTPYPYGGTFPYDVRDPILDVATTLAWVAAATTHVRLGSTVIVLPYHQPIPLAKALATVDVLSGGRLLVGVASGWLAEEFALLGVPFAERGARFEESVTLLKKLWTDDLVTFHGRFFDVTDAAFFPKPVQRPHPPVWIGGASKVALERVGRLGDGWLAVPRPDVAALAADIALIRRAAEVAGRDPRTIGVASSGGATSVETLVARLPDLERIGVTIVTVPALYWAKSVPAAIDLMAEFAARAGLASRG